MILEAVRTSPGSSLRRKEEKDQFFMMATLIPIDAKTQARTPMLWLVFGSDCIFDRLLKTLGDIRQVTEMKRRKSWPNMSRPSVTRSGRHSRSWCALSGFAPALTARP